MPRSNTGGILSANFVFCAIFVSISQLVGSIYLLSTSSCDSVLGHTTSVDTINPQAQEIRSMTKSTSPESSGNAMNSNVVDPDALDCKSYLQEYRTGMRRSLLPVSAMGYKALSYRA